MHVYGTYTYAGSYMHPVHCKQEMLLNLRVCGDSQNLIGQEILRSSYCTNKKTRYLVQIFEGGGGVLYAHKPYFLNTYIETFLLNR